MRKYLGLGVSLLASVALVAACGGGSGSDETTEPTAQTSEDAGGGAAAGAELVVWSDAERAEAIENAAAQFEEDTGATVTVVQKNFEDLRADFLAQVRSEEHTSELQSRGHLVCRLLLEKKKKQQTQQH